MSKTEVGENWSVNSGHPNRAQGIQQQCDVSAERRVLFCKQRSILFFASFSRNKERTLPSIFSLSLSTDQRANVSATTMGNETQIPIFTLLAQAFSFFFVRSTQHIALADCHTRRERRKGRCKESRNLQPERPCKSIPNYAGNCLFAMLTLGSRRNDSSKYPKPGTGNEDRKVMISQKKIHLGQWAAPRFFLYGLDS